MALASNAQWSFAGGEWSKASQGRFDMPAYATAMNVSLNGIPTDEGAWLRRFGTAFRGYTYQGLPAKMQRFGLSGRAPLLLEFTDSNMRYWDGSGLMPTKDARTVLLISAADPGVFTTDVAHNWATNDEVQFDSLTPALQRRVFRIIVTGAATFTAVDSITGVSLSGVGVPALIAVRRVQRTTTPYAAGAWSTLQSVQAEKESVLLNGQRPNVVTAADDPTDPDGLPLFTFNPIILKDGPYLDLVEKNSQLNTAGLQGIVSVIIDFAEWDAAKSYSIGDYATYTSVSYRSLVDLNVNNQPNTNPADWVVADASELFGPSGLQDTDVGRSIRLHSEPADWDVATAYAAKARVKFAGTYWAALQATTGDEPGADIKNWILSVDGAHRWTWGRITGLGSLIPNDIVGATDIGNYTEDGGLAAAFDGNLSQPKADSAGASLTFPFMTRFSTSAYLQRFIGRNYTGASPQTIKQVTLYPPSDDGFIFTLANGGYRERNSVDPFTCNLRLNLRGKVGTAPSSSSDGTVLGTVEFTRSWASGNLAAQLLTDKEITFGFPTSPISITSTDQTTAFDHIWVEAEVQYKVNDVRSSPSAFIFFTTKLYIAEMRLFSATSGAGAGFDVEIIGKPLLNNDPIREWRLGVYADSTSWPRCGTYHEGRLWLAGAVKNRFDASRSNKIFDFAPTEEDGTVAPSNGISYVLNSTEVNDIYWMEPDVRGIICGTKTAEWLIAPGSAGAIAPANIKATPGTRAACANIPPARTEHTVVFTHLSKGSVREIFADVNASVFSTTNISERARDITKIGVEQIVYMAEPTPLIWVRRTDGSIAGCTYKRNVLSVAREPEVMGWHRHLHGTGRRVSDMAVGSLSASDTEALTLISAGADDLYAVEQLIPHDRTLPWLLDYAANPSSRELGVSSAIFYGFDHLEGEVVTVYAGGLDCGDHTVVDGAVTVPYGNGVSGGTGGGKFTAAFLDPPDPEIEDPEVVIGFNFLTQGQRLRPMSQQDTGTRAGLFALGKVRRAHGVAMLVEYTKGLSIGTDFDNLRPANFVTKGERPLGVLDFFSGIHRDTLDDTFSYDSMVCWQISRPYPLTLMAVGQYLRTQD